MTAETRYPSSNSGPWTNGGNAYARDNVYATAFVNIDVDGNITDSGVINVGTFNFALGAGDTIQGVEVWVDAHKAGNATVDLTAFLISGSTPVGNQKPIASGLTTSDADYSAGGAADTWGATLAGADINQLKIGVFATPNGLWNKSATVYLDAVWVTVYYTGATANALAFGSQSGLTINSLVLSASPTVSGSGGPYTAALEATGHDGTTQQQWRKNGGAWTSSPGTVNNGDSVQMRQYVGAAFNTTYTSRMLVGGTYSTGFTTTSEVQDTTPSNFVFNDVSGVNPSSLNTSNSITVTGINSPATITVSGGEYRKNGGAWVSSSGSVNNGDTVEARVQCGASFSTGYSVTVTIGGVSDTYTATTRAADTTPNPFPFTDLSGQAATTVITSNTVTVTGIEAAASVSFATSGNFTSAQYSKNAGAWTAVGATTVNNNDTLQLRLTSGTANQTGNIQVTIGGVSDTWSVTVAGDSLPDTFAFTNRTNVIPGDPGPHNSGDAQIVGISAGISIAASAPYCDVADKISAPVDTAFVDPDPNVELNDYIRVRTKTDAPIPKCGQQTLSMLVTVGSGSATWTITTKPGMPAGQLIC